jgi:Tyrosine phosphatase family
MAEGLIQDSLQLLLNPISHPILVTSTSTPPPLCPADNRSGVREVGILMGILRKLQHWSFSSIIFEYRAFAGANARFNEEQFIELFDIQMVKIPERVPSWWIVQQEIFQTEHAKPE